MTLTALMLAFALQQPAPSAPAPDNIQRGLDAFKHRRFSAARAAFQQALDADPGSAAAHFYLGYTYYKIGEPSRRMNADKQRAKDLFGKAFAIDPSFQPAWRR